MRKYIYHTVVLILWAAAVSLLVINYRRGMELDRQIIQLKLDIEENKQRLKVLNEEDKKDL